MAKKTVCDICGADATPHEFVVPFVNTYWAINNGVKLGKLERIETCAMNFCGKHYRQVAQILKNLHDECNEG